MNPDFAEYFYLALAWVLWCVLHSLPLEPGIRQWIKRRWGLSDAAYRVVYSLYSVATVIPPLWLLHRLQGGSSFLWPWPWWILQALVWLGGVGLMYRADRDFKKGGFDIFGANDLMRHEDRPHPLVTSGVYALMRHPMHVAGFCLIWARGLSPADVVVNVFLSLYFILGSLLEERRLLAQFGDEYRDYMARVPAIPLGFLKG